ncbi:MAG: pyridoxal phosphate-dependent aminotransferase [Vulcanimicrobiaceae bacterium]
MSDMISATPIAATLPHTQPFVGPEELARRVGRTTLVRLGANESGFGASPHALAAMRDALAEVSYYGDPDAMDVRVALAAKHGCAIEEVALGAGIDDLLGLIVRAYLAPGDVTVATRGSYPTYTYHVLGYGARLETVPYRDDGTVPLAELAARARATHARVVYLANPDNPSGTFAPRAEIEAFVDALPAHAMLVLDEAYGDFVATSDLLRDGVHPRVVRTRTFSKAYGMAGARIAYAIAPADAIATLDKLRHHFGVNRIAQRGALAALGDPAFVAHVVAEVERGRDAYVALARRAGCATLPSRANFVCIDLGSRARAEAMVEALLRRGIFVRKPGLPPLDGFIRVTVGAPADRAAFAEAFELARARLDARVSA